MGAARFARCERVTIEVTYEVPALILPLVATAMARSYDAVPLDFTPMPASLAGAANLVIVTSAKLLEATLALADTGSFDRAARALHVTPSAISQRIRLLEERVGCALVVRGQPCRPTDTGRRMCQHMDRVRLLERDLNDALPALAPEGAPAPAKARMNTSASRRSVPVVKDDGEVLTDRAALGQSVCVLTKPG